MPDLRKRRLKMLRRRAPPPIPPSAVQLAYYADLKRVLAYADELVRERLLARLPELTARADAMHADARDPGKRVNRIMDRISERFYRKYAPERLEKLAERYARATSDHQKRDLFRQIKQTLGVQLSAISDRTLGPLIRQFTATNVALIKSVPQKYFDDVEKRVLAGMRSGKRHEEVAKEIEARLGVAQESAKLIARDQVLSFQADLNRERQQSLGITRYIWRTVSDSRVRPEHEERDGNTYSWDDPPGDVNDPGDGGHPGEGINCRCYSEPVIEDLLTTE